MMGEDYYSVLGVTRSSTREEIRLAYVELARKYHPDANPNNKNGEIFLVIQRAYETLSNTQKRKEYDQGANSIGKSSIPIQMSWSISRNEIPIISESQMVYGKLDIKYSGNQKNYNSPPSHLCIVLDRSTSMKGERLDSVRENIRHLISELRFIDLISIVTFNDKAEILVAPTTVSSKQTIFEKISSIKAAGGTEIFKGLKAGIDLLWQGNSKSYLPNLLLLTDGHTYGDEEICIELAHNAVEKNIKINALGFGNEWNDKFLDHLSGITGGCTYYVKTLFDLPRLLQITLTTLSTTVVHNINLEVLKNDQVQLKFIFKLEPEIVQLEIDDPIQLGNLIKEKTSSYLFAFELSPLNKETEEVQILKGKLRFLMGENSKIYSENELLINLRANEKPNNLKIPLEIVQALSKITLYQMQEKSHEDVEHGKVNDAVRRLTYVATHLIGQGNVPFAKEVLTEAENIKKEQSYSEDGIKRLKYGTRALLQLPEPEKRKQ